MSSDELGQLIAAGAAVSDQEVVTHELIAS